MRKISASFVAYLLISLPVFAQFPVQGGTFGGRIARPPRDASTPPATGTSRIRGRVVSAAGQPLRRAGVRIVAPELGEPRFVRTDTDGRYEIADLPAGRYTVTATKGGYVTLSFGQRRPNEPGTPLELKNDQTLERVDFRLPQGGVITGQVLDEAGEPVVNAMVQPLQAQFFNGRRQLMPNGPPSMTPDTGEFRLWGLMPGQYIVSVTLRGEPLMGGQAGPADRFGYAPSYYPGTANAAEAQPVTVGVGQTVNGLTLTLVPTRTASVSGMATDSQGRPVLGMVMAIPRTTGLMMVGIGMHNAAIRPDGSFTLSGLAPGDYNLRAIVPSPSGGRGTGESLEATVSVAGEDVRGVTLVPVVPARVSGRIVVEQGGAQPLRAAAIRLMAMPKTPELMGFAVAGGPPRVRDDFTFELTASPGTTMIRAVGMEAGWVLKSVRHQGVDVTDSGLDLAPGQSIEGLEIELTTRVQEVAGLVTDSSNKPVKDYSVLLFGQNRDLWVGTTRHVAVARADQDGRYKVRTLPPGDYYAVALEYVDQTRIGDPEYMESLKADATAFSLSEAEVKAMDLKLKPGR